MFLISEPGGEGQAEHAAEHVSVTRVAQRLEQAVPLLQQDPFLIMALSLDTVESRLLIRRNLHQNTVEPFLNAPLNARVKQLHGFFVSVMPPLRSAARQYLALPQSGPLFLSGPPS